MLASDGIWELVDNERVGQIIMPFYKRNNIKGACDSLIEEAIQTWKSVNFLAL